MRLLAQEVMPQFRQHVTAQAAEYGREPSSANISRRVLSAWLASCRRRCRPDGSARARTRPRDLFEGERPPTHFRGSERYPIGRLGLPSRLSGATVTRARDSREFRAARARRRGCGSPFAGEHQPDVTAAHHLPLSQARHRSRPIAPAPCCHPPSRRAARADRRHDQPPLLVDLQVHSVAGGDPDLLQQGLRNDDAVRVAHLSDLASHARALRCYNNVDTIRSRIRQCYNTPRPNIVATVLHRARDPTPTVSTLL